MPGPSDYMSDGFLADHAIITTKLNILKPGIVKKFTGISKTLTMTTLAMTYRA